jgi:HEAT repeat protein
MVMPNDSGFGEMLDPTMMGMEDMGLDRMAGMFAAQVHGTPQKTKLALRLIGPVSEAATDSEPSVRRAAVQLLFKLATIKPDESLVKPLLGALRDDHAQVRSYAAHGLGRLGPMAAEAVDELAAAVGDADLSVRSAALDALASMGSHAKAATPAVVAALRAPESQIRWVAARTLGAMQAPPPPRPAQNPGGFNMMMEDEMMTEGEMMGDPALQSLPGAAPAPASNPQPPGI